MSNQEMPPEKLVQNNPKRARYTPRENRREKKTVWELATCKKRCFICTKPLVGNPSFLQKAKTKYSSVTFATCLKDIANNKFPVAVAVDDRCCCECASLIQNRDQLERDLKIVNNTLFTRLKASCSVRNIGNNSTTTTIAVEANADLGSVVSISVTKEETVVRSNPGVSKDVLYECGTCQKLFNNTDVLYKHSCLEQTPVSVAEKPVKCYPGSKKRPTITAATNHQTQSEEPEAESTNYQECKKCKLMFPTEKKLQEHFESHDKFRCSTCEKQFKDKSAFEKHLIVTAKLQQDFCIVCNQIFSTKEALTAHQAESHSQNDANDNLTLRVIYMCSCCGSELPDAKAMNDHKATHLMVSIENEPSADEAEDPLSSAAKATSFDHSYSLEMPEIKLNYGPANNVKEEPQENSKSRVYECGMCDVRATSVNNLLEHFNTHKDQPINCKHCGINMPSIAALSKHLQYHVKTGQGIECLKCKLTLDSKDQLMKHMLDYHNYKQQCVHCGEQFRYAADLSQHKTLHPESRNFVCLFCNERFSSMVQLERHQSQLHREPKCNVCGKEILDRKKLREHELRHRKDLNPCPKCHRIFKSPSGLKNHMPVHTGKYKFKCDTCQKGFMNRSIFREHVNNHLEHPVMLYKCKHCDRGFSHQGSLWIHEKWHKNPFPYQCNLCGKKLRHSSILAAHMRRHQGLRPYKCPHCNQSFTSGSAYKRHMMLHTGIYAYTCLECKKGLTTKQKYHHHRYTAHGIPFPAKKDVPLKMSLGKPNPADSYQAENALTQEETAISYIVGNFDASTEGQVLPAVLEVATDEQQQAVASLELLDENSTSWTVVSIGTGSK